MDAHVDCRELERLVQRLEQSPQVLREARRQALEEAAPRLKGLVDREIGGTGRVRGWQAQAVGSGGGYAAVRPKAGTYAQDRRGRPTKYTVGCVTGAVNSGHRVRPDRFGYRRSARTVPGKHFYQRAQAQAGQVAQQAAEEILQALADHLEG